jgi:hypothetical protein
LRELRGGRAREREVMKRWGPPRLRPNQTGALISQPLQRNTWTPPYLFILTLSLALTLKRSPRKLDHCLTLCHPIHSTFGLLGSWFGRQLAHLPPSTHFTPGNAPTGAVHGLRHQGVGEPRAEGRAAAAAARRRRRAAGTVARPHGGGTAHAGWVIHHPLCREARDTVRGTLREMAREAAPCCRDRGETARRRHCTRWVGHPSPAVS